MENGDADKPAHVAMLHVFPSFGFGGQQARFAALASGLGPEFSHLVVALDGDFAARALIDDDAAVDCRSLAVKKSSLPNLGNLLRFRKLLKAAQPDLLCTYNWGAIEAALANNLFAHVPHVHFEDGFGPEESAGTQLKRRVLARRMVLSGSTVVVPSTGLEETALGVWKLGPERVARIANGVDFDRFQQPSSPPRNDLIVGAVGALRPEKNFARLIAAFLTADFAKRARLVIVGDGPERGRLAALVNAHDAAARVTLAGASARPEAFYRDFDIFALSSDTEQAPLTLMEAMAAGLPVVATNVGDVAAMTADENRAFVTPLGDDGAYHMAMTHLLQNADARATLGAANRKKARMEFSLDAMIKRHRRLYLAKVGARG